MEEDAHGIVLVAANESTPEGDIDEAFPACSLLLGAKVIDCRGRWDGVEGHIAYGGYTSSGGRLFRR